MNESLNKAYSVLHVKDAREDPTGLTVEGIATTPTADRVEDVVEPMGAKFQTPMPLLLYHHNEKPVGNMTFARPTPKGIPFKAFLPYVKEAGIVKDRVDEAIHSLKYRLISAVSIGFKPVKGAVERIKDGGFRFKEWEWFELSLVTIPANAEATITNIKALDAQQSAASGAATSGYAQAAGLPPWNGATVTTTTTTTHPGDSGKPLSLSHRNQMKTSVAEQIGNFEAERSYKSQRMEEIMRASIDENRTFTADEEAEHKDLEKGIEDIDKQVATMRKHEKLLLTATPVNQNDGSDPDRASEVRQNAGRPSSVSFSKRNQPQGTGFTRLAMAIMAGKGSESDTEKYIQRNFRDTPEVGMAYKAAIAAGTTTDSNWAAPLVNYTDLASEFIELLRPVTILGRLTGVRRVPFNVRIAKLATGATAQWVGQGLAKPLSALDFDSITMQFTKLATIVVLTEELVRFSSPSAEAAVRQEIVSAVAQAMDQTFIDPSVAAVANVSPASITNGISARTSTGNSVATTTADLTSIISVMATANINISSGVWIMRPSTAVYLSTLRTTQDILAYPGMSLSGGSLLGFPVIVSGNMPADTGSSSYIVFLVQDEIYVADDGTTRVDASKEASLQMDSAPSAGAQAMVSMWQNNMVALKAERFANWARRRDAAVGVIQDVSY